MPRYAHERQPYRTPPELGGPAQLPDIIRQYPVAIVGAGPIGLAAAIDLALHGVPSVVLDDNDVVSVGSRAICWAKRTLEIFDRLGVGDRMVAKGVTWRVGRLFHGDREVYSFDLLPEPGHKRPAFINLQQYYVEEYLIDRARDFPDLIDLRFKNRVAGLDQAADHVTLSVQTPDGTYPLRAAYVLACDGSRSAVRDMIGLDFAGRIFEERFLIADVEMTADVPNERWFWFDPPFHNGQSALLHKQPDNIYRIDLQLGWDADPEHEKQPAVVVPRIQAMVGDRPFTLDWVSVYTFQCRRLERFVHDRVIFVGDSAHVVSPFGARGGNGGIQDVDNLCWKLAAILAGRASPALLASYDEERIFAADENITHSTRATNFMTPKSAGGRLLRDAVLTLAGAHDFARRLVNSGRLSRPCTLRNMSLQTPLAPGLVDPGENRARPGDPCPDAPLMTQSGASTHLLDHLGGDFSVLHIDPHDAVVTGSHPDPLKTIIVRTSHTGHTDRPAHARPSTVAAINLLDIQGLFADRYGHTPGLTYLIRPDQHIAACLLNPSAAELNATLDRAHGNPAAPAMPAAIGKG